MSITIDNIVDKILSNNLDKREALTSFDSLSEEEKNALIAKLQFELSVSDQTILGQQIVKNNLKARDQRDLNDQHHAFIKLLSKEYEDFVPKSKENISEHQNYFVDQRRAFHLIKDLKKIHFQITYEKAKGAYVYDIDGNKYIDISGDMGVNIFGHQPDFIVNALKDSLDQGMPLVGYSEKIFKTAKIFSELTGHERVLFTQSGTEAVMFAVRIARAATQKKKVVVFDGSYHGLSDAVTAMSDLQGKSLAMGPGMLQEFADQIIVLEYGNMKHLDIIEARADEISCVLVEPVQSRHPYNQPVEFLKEIRKLTLEQDIALIFDEIITGFRVCHRGAQGYFNIKADIATYGKIPGGGLPTGVIAGTHKYMDLVDGGTWNLDDDSMPKSKRTGMAGTHSQNPLKISAMFATLSEIRARCSEDLASDNCQCFQKGLNKKTKSLSEELNLFFSENKLPIVIDFFGSLFRFRFVDSYWGITEALFFIILRMKGIETNIQGNCFLTTAHSDKDLKSVVKGIKESLLKLIQEDFFYEAEVIEDESKDEAISDLNDVTDIKSQVTAVESNNEMEKLKNLLKSDLQNFQEGEY